VKKKEPLLTGKEMKALLKKGSSGYTQRDMAKALEIDERTLRRYVSGKVPIPKVVQVAVSCFIDHDDEHRDRVSLE
jgi:hypothetical protein